MALTAQKRDAVRDVVSAIVECVGEAGELGCPGGVLYAAMMDRISLDTFQNLMGLIVDSGRLRRQGHLYFVPA